MAGEALDLSDLDCYRGVEHADMPRMGTQRLAPGELHADYVTGELDPGPS